MEGLPLCWDGSLAEVEDIPQSSVRNIASQSQDSGLSNLEAEYI